MSVVINEVIRRSEQGVTRPFLCRGCDEKFYFVKGSGVGQESLRAEWLAGCLAQSLRLPIPGFKQVEVSEAIIQFSLLPGINELGTGIAFGSEVVPGAQEILLLQTEKVALDLQAKVLVFDWWIQNSDRSLTTLGGNSNLLSAGHENPELSIIDHHGAFDSECNPSDIWSSHIFRDARSLWTDAFKGELLSHFQGALVGFSGIWSSMPDSWFPDKDRDSDASKLELERVSSILKRPFDSPKSFWDGNL